MLLLALNSNINAQTEVVIQANKDNTLYESNTGALSNGKGAHFFVGKTAVGSIRRGLLAFDIAGNIESGVLIDSVVLILSMSKTRTATSRIIALHKILSSWGEGESNAPGNEGAGTAAEIGDATWIHTFYDSLFWTNNGGDFSDVINATASVGDTNSYRWNSTSELVADVQSWLDSPSTNFGWILVGDENESATAKRFDSKENSTESNRPILRVFYMPVVAVATLSNELPIRYDLEQNYPNPFNPVTTIAYDIPEAADVRIDIYDILGQKVRTLVNSMHEAAFHKVVWNSRDDYGKSVPSGMYIYRITATDPSSGKTNFTKARKLVMIK
ncbi:MAG: DNRLRE domain-containing protein [Candidatus Marinimicrobia bacterium]|nr:DNRLRE domain-containing protein [Candidatus Neomarinimicrobiota bacterium]